MMVFSKIKTSKKYIPSLHIRHANKNDAAEIVRLARSLSKTDGHRPSCLTEECFCKDGFGNNPAFKTLIAQTNKEIIGYTLYFEGYNTNSATRGLYISDLYVDEPWRGKGVGYALMQATSIACKKAGGEWMFWAVNKKNKGARKFYKKLSTEIREVSIFSILGDKFQNICNAPNSKTMYLD
tara:strand:- start:652 stop:1194 length:543 start_codon:yes stop_codon:yes gene_type:complete